MKHLFTLKSLLLTLVMLFGLNAWGETVEITTSQLVTKYDWTVSFSSTIGTVANSFNLDDNIQISTTGTGNCGTIWGSAPNNDWRIYQNAKGNVIVTALNGCQLESVTFTFSNSKNGTLKDGSTTLTSGTAYAVSGTSKEFTVGNSSTATNGQIRITKFSVTYTTAGGGEAVTVAKPTFSPAGGTYYAAQEVEIQIPAGAEKVMYTIDGTEPSLEKGVGQYYENTITVSKTTTIKAIALDNLRNASAVASATYTIEPSIANTKETALTVAEAKNLIDNTSAEQLADPTQKVYVKGTISKIDSFNETYGSITYWLDDNTFEVYGGLDLNNEKFSSIDDIVVGASVIVYGNVKNFNSTYEFDKNNYLVQYTAPAGFVEKPVITETSTPDFGYSYYTTSTATATIASATEGATIQYAITGVDVTDAATIESWKEGASVSITSDVAGTKILWAKAVKDGKESVVASKEFTFTTDVAPEGTYFVLVTDASQIVEGAKYVITSETDDAAMLGWETGDKNCKPQSVTASNGVLELPADFTGIITLGKTETGYTLKQLDGLYLTATGTDKNYLVAKSALEDNSYWTITIGNNNVASIKNVNNSSRGVMQYNSSSTLFACYNGESQESLHLYRMAKEVPVATKTGLDAVLAGKVNVKYQINCALRVNYKDANYAYASTTENNSSKKNTANEGDKGLGWSDKEEKFTQNDWVAIQNSGLELGNQVAIGSVATLVSNGAFPVIEFVSMSKDAPETPFEANTFRVANFNIGKDENAVKNVWLVAPQAGEYCHVRGYVAAAEGGKVTLKSAQESSTEIIGGTPITVDPVKMTVNYTGAVTTGNWFSFTGIVVNGKDGLELNAISAEDVSTGVEGVEASSVKVYGAEGVINVVSEEVAPIAVYSANGAIVSSVEASSASIAVAPGFYIVKAGNSVSKVTVK